MSLLALSLVVSVSSGGFLSEREPSPQQHLVDAGALAFAGAAATQTTLGAASIETMSMGELEAERARLLESRPGRGGAIALLVGGGVCTVLGLTFLLAAIDLPFVEVIVIGAVLTIVGVAALVGGVVLMVIAGSAIANINEQVRAIDARERQLNGPSNDAPPPPPPPPPPAGWLTPVGTPLTVAVF
ncbi:MAG: phage holin family protein [Myxococcaceae bacterium]